MKTKLIMLVLLTLNKTLAYSESKASETNRWKTSIQTTQDTLLLGMQNKIDAAFVQSLMTKKSQPLRDLSSQMETLNERQNLIHYWRSYLQYYAAIFYLEQGDKKAAEDEIDKGIEILKDLEQKNAEDYALLALMQSFSIQFKGMRAMFISSSIKKNAKKAIAIDTTNLRAWYVYGSNDFYTPEKYGGGKEAEQYLLKAISLPSQKVKNDYLPSWGKENAYQLLVRYYIRQKQWKLAKEYFQKGIEIFPDSFTLNQLATELVGK